MFIQIQTTPNPETMKFLPGIEIMRSGHTATFNLNDHCNEAPLAKHLLQINGIASIFFSQDFISVTKAPEHDWSALKTLVMAGIMDHFIAGYPVVLERFYNVEVKSTDYSDEIVTQIKEIIETKVRPAVAEDGGDIVYHDFKDGIVYLQMHGACSGCPSSTVTLKSGIEKMLKHYVPEVVSVEAI